VSSLKRVLLVALVSGVALLHMPAGIASQAQALESDGKAGKLAVFDIVVDGVDLSEKQIKNLTAHLTSCVTAGGAYISIASNRIDKELVRVKAESHADACDKSCQIALGQKLSADKVLHAFFWRVGKSCSLNLDLYDLEGEVMEKSVVVSDVACNEPGLFKAVTEGARQLNAMASVVKRPPLPDERKTELPPPPEVTQSDSELGGNAPPPAVKSETGYLYVQGQPKGARVDITGPKGFGDKGKVATSLPVAPFEVPAGQYTIKVSQKGYDSEETQVRIFADATDGVKVSLVQSNGQVQISGKPEGAKSRLTCPKGFVQDFGLPAASSPWTVTVPRGECRLTVERDGYAGYDETFTVAGGGMSRQTVELVHDIPGERSRVVAGTGGVKWVRIPGGTFQMGSNDDSVAKPVHSVTVPTFEMAKTETTVAQYKKCVDAGACTSPHSWRDCNWDKLGRGNHPVNCIDWNQASAYANWVGGRLPTEAEWEYAARSGGRNQRSPWGDHLATCTYAVVDDLGGDGCGVGTTWPVCSKPAGNTSQGLCDMIGNVWEMVQDVWHDNYVGAPSNGAAWEDSGTRRVYRGCGWYIIAKYGNATYRSDGGFHPLNSAGLRPARSVQ